MSKTLIVRASAIGDFVLNIPALQALHKVQPYARFTLVGYPSTLELAREFIPVDAIYSIETQPWSRLFHEPISGWHFDSAVIWMKEPTFSDNLRLSGIPNVLRADPFPQYDHASTHLLRTLKVSRPPLPDLWEPSSADIILQPGSGSLRKNWPYFEDLANSLRERVPDGRVKTGIPEGLTLVEVSHFLRHVRAYIGNDSGITHLAAFLGVPTVAVFGPTDPRVWGPIGRRSRIIWKTTLEEISVDEVLLAHATDARTRANG